MKIMIVGGSFAGVYCGLHAAKLYPEAEIHLFEKSELLGFLPSGLLMYLQGEFANLEEAVFVNEKELKQVGIQLHLKEKYLECNPETHVMTTNKGEYVYDKLVLALGSKQQSKNINTQEGGIYSYKTYEEAKFLLPKIEKAEKINIIGAGQAGLEAASTFVNLGKKVQLIEAMNYPLFKYFDEDILQRFVSAITRIDMLDIHFNHRVEELLSDEEVLLTTVNVHPNKLVQDVVAAHSDQTIETNQFLETSQKDIFAVGDLIQVPFKLTNEKIYLPQINNAIQSGIIAAENLFEPRRKFQGGLRTIGTELFGWYLASTGLLEAEGFLYADEITVKKMTIPIHLNDSGEIYCKFILDKNHQSILGVQLLSQQNCLAWINRWADAISFRATLEEVVQQDFFFHPQYPLSLNFLKEYLLGRDWDEA